jgi:voltage-gated potassium channel
MSVRSVWRSWRLKVHDILEVGGWAHPAGRVVNALIIILIFANAIAFAAETVDSVAQRYGRALDVFNDFSVVVFTIEYVLRLWSCIDIPLLSRLPHWRARIRFALRPIMLIDLFAILPWYLSQIMGVDLRLLRVLRLFRLLKLVRYSPALQTLQRVMAHEWRALVGALLVMLILLLFSSTIIYFIERDAQPDTFGSIPASAWWALATLSTIGYGDVVPITPLGKLFGGVVMLFGIAMFALPIAILATGFSQESSRHEFVVTWSMVARVPLFSGMDAAEVAEITKLLYTRSFPAGATIVRSGDSGDAMYLIGSGEAMAATAPGRWIDLHEGDFFGEMALLERRRHKHDVIAKTACRIYVLDGEGLARLSRRHPEIVRHIRKVAMERENESGARRAKIRNVKARTRNKREVRA